MRVELAQLAGLVVGWAIPDESCLDSHTIYRRLLTHAQMCSRWVAKDEMTQEYRIHGTSPLDLCEPLEKETTLFAVHLLGNVFFHCGKLAEAEKMYECAL